MPFIASQNTLGACEKIWNDKIWVSIMDVAGGLCIYSYL